MDLTRAAPYEAEILVVRPGLTFAVDVLAGNHSVQMVLKIVDESLAVSVYLSIPTLNALTQAGTPINWNRGSSPAPRIFAVPFSVAEVYLFAQAYRN